jgi:hypothetical protein
VSEPPLFLHEVIDIVGLGATPYMRHTLEATGNEKTNFELQGTFSVMGITGRWPQVVNVWDVPGGWDGWQESVERLNLARADNAELERWWLEAYKHRTGGFDRLLAGAPGCPTTAELVAAGVHATLFVHEIAEVRAGAQLDYLATTLAVRAPVLADYGHTLTGLYQVAFTDHEVITMWATDPSAHVRLARSDDTRLVAWRTEAAHLVRRRREELLTPFPGTVIGPPVDPEGGRDAVLPPGR